MFWWAKVYQCSYNINVYCTKWMYLHTVLWSLKSFLMMHCILIFLQCYFMRKEQGSIYLNYLIRYYILNTVFLLFFHKLDQIIGWPTFVDNIILIFVVSDCYFNVSNQSMLLIYLKGYFQWINITSETKNLLMRENWASADWPSAYRWHCFF